MNFLDWLKRRWKEARTIDQNHIKQNLQEGLISQKILATSVGLVALLLAFALPFVDGFNGVTCTQASLSHYYFVPGAGDVFVIALAVVGVVLIAYRGENRTDAFVASVAGFTAFMVALFPTSGLGCIEGVAQELRGNVMLTPDGDYTQNPLPKWFGKVHYAAAAFLLIALTYFAAWSFTRVADGRDRVDYKQLTGRKTIRNTLYFGCAGVMAVGLVIFVLDFTKIWPRPLGPRTTYWAELIVLSAFGISWFVKGSRVFGLLADPDDTFKKRGP